MTARIAADYVIVGAGSAGCVLANRLSANPSNRVLLLEAGHDDRPLRRPSQFLSNLNIQIPAGWTRLLADPAVNWNFLSAPEPGVGGRVLALPRGKVLGGSSAINGMVYMRGLPSDYETWRQLGCTGWGWDDVLPIFKRMEHAPFGDPAVRGRGGPLRIRKAEDCGATMDALIKATLEAGLSQTDDYNGLTPDGVTNAQQNSYRGVRASAAAAYLHPVSNRKNLRIETGALVSRVMIEDGRAVGVEFERNGVVTRVDAAAEVILCGGAFNSPVLLELSGIGSGQRLQDLGIPVVADRPSVGENLQDHYLVSVSARLKDGTQSLNGSSAGWPLAKAFAEYALLRRGLLASASCTINGYARTRPDVDIPDMQLMSSAGTVDLAATMSTGAVTLDSKPGLTIGGWVLRPESRGFCHASSASPSAAPAIQMNFLSTPADELDVVNMMRVIRSMFRQPSMVEMVEHELGPIRDIPEDDIGALIRICREIGTSGYHPVGTCRMGGDDESVVDPQLKVRGITGLRVADASVMPRLTSGNTNAPTMMIGEMASDLILKSA
ncbi:MAG: GMC family oxidoreductase N-terminal domain-containing protein [Novosphingobium sp.]